MEEYYHKPDNRKPWQKNILIAWLVLLAFYVIEFFQGIPLRINKLLDIVFYGKRQNQFNRKKDTPSAGFGLVSLMCSIECFSYLYTFGETAVFI